MLKISSLKEKLLVDMKVAMKNRDKERLSVIRMARASIKNVEIAKRKDLEDSEVIEVLAREVKQRRDSMAEYQRVGKEETAEQLKQEIKVLKDYLPRQLSREEVAEIVDEVITETGASSMADMGKVMGTIMSKIKGRAEGRVVSEIVQEKLT